MENISLGLRSLVLLFVLVVWGSPASALTTLSLQPDNTTPAVGSSFVVSVNISDAVDLFAYQFDIQFDPVVLSGTSVTEGPFLATGGSTIFIAGTIDNAAGTITFTAGTLETAVVGVDGNGTLATLTFTALATASNSPIVFGEVILLDSALGDIEFGTTGTSVSPVIRNGVVPEPNSSGLLSLGILGVVILRRMRGYL